MVNLKKDIDATRVREVNISIPSIDDVKEFVNVACRHKCTATLTSDRYTVDAKSIMGVFSLDVSKPIKLRLESNSPNTDDCLDFLNNIKPFIITEE